MTAKKYTLEYDIEVLTLEGSEVLATTKVPFGHAILWKDEDGYSVTVRHNTHLSVGRTLKDKNTVGKEYAREVKDLVDRALWEKNHA